MHIHQQNIRRFITPLPAFSTIIVFVILSMIGLVVIPFLSVRTESSQTNSSISVYYFWYKANSEKLEQEVTSRIEGVVATVKGVKNIRSTSGNGNGYIHIDLDEHAPKDQCRYEIATLIRQLYPHLPEGVSFPVVELDKVFRNGNKTLLNYAINGRTTAAHLQEIGEKLIKPNLASIKGVSHVNIYGGAGFAWELQFKPEVLVRYGISTTTIMGAVSDYFQSYELGRAYLVNDASPERADYAYLTLRTDRPETIAWNKIPVTKAGGRVLYLTDLVQPRFVEKEPESYSRVNGLNTVNIEITAAAGANYIVLANKIRDQVAAMQANLPAGTAVVMMFDATDHLNKELRIVSVRTLATLGMLLLFVLLVNRSWRYLYVIVLSLIANLLVSFIFYYFLKLEINMTSMAGITVSMGMMIDNSIVVIDHIRNRKNLRVIIAVAGATFSTIGAVCIIFFLGEQQQLKLLDFACIIIVNLGVSLFIALFFIPALMQQLPLPKRPFASQISKKRRIVAWNKFYAGSLRLATRFRTALTVLLILLFGIPVFMLPDKIENNTRYAKWYNAVFDNAWYKEHIKPRVDVGLGGTLRLFIARPKRFLYNESSQKRSELFVRINMPNGASLQQMNMLVKNWENYLSQFNEIQLFQSDVHSGQQADIIILFKKEFDKGFFPGYLKGLLENKAVYTGLADFNIAGVGNGFNNTLHIEKTNQAIILQGYNYKALHLYAGKVKSLLLQNPRVEKASIGSTRDADGEKTNYEFVFRVADQEKLLQSSLSPLMISNALADFSGGKNSVHSIFDKGKQVPVVLAPFSEPSSMWRVMNDVVRSDSAAYVRLKEFATVEKEVTGNEIARVDQQYQLVVNYNFLGDHYLASIVAERIIEQVGEQLPVGFSIKSAHQNFWRGAAKNLTWAIFLALGIVFIVCAVLLNSLKQSLAVIAMAPISFIGVFISAGLFEYNFDEGGYAAFIVLCGVTVNAALYILNDFNNLKKEYPGKPLSLLYLKAFNSKIIPVILSTASMILGLIPLIIDARNEPFWYPLAMSVTGGAFIFNARHFVIPAFILKTLWLNF